MSKCIDATVTILRRAIQCPKCHYTHDTILGAFIPVECYCPNCGARVRLDPPKCHSNTYDKDGNLVAINKAFEQYLKESEETK